MPSIDIRFGAYQFESNTDVTMFEVENESRVLEQAIPRRHGWRADEAYISGMRIRIGGTIIGTDAAEARATLNAMKNAFNSGKQLLRIWSDREVLCQKSYFLSRVPKSIAWEIEWEAELFAEDYAFRSVSITEQEETIASSPETNSFTNNGNVPSTAIIRITAGSSNIAAGLRIDNETTGEYFTYNAQIDAGDWIEIDTDLHTVVDQDGNNVFQYFAQTFFKLDPGANSIKWTGTATGSPKLKLSYYDKYDGY